MGEVDFFSPAALGSSAGGGGGGWSVHFEGELYDLYERNKPSIQ